MFVFGPALLASAPTVTVWWKVGAVAINIVLLLGVAIYVLSIMRRLNRLHDEVVRDIVDEEPFVMLPDDGQMIVVYAKKSRVVFYIVRLALLSGILTTVGAWISIDPRYQTGVVLIAFLDLFLGVFLVLGIARLISKTPVLIVNAEGITDNSTLIATGMGMVPWREVLGLRIPSARSARFLTVEADNNTILREQALWKRALLVLVRSPLGLIRIREFLLPMPLEELRAQIEEYARAHGHVLPLSRVPVGANSPTSAN